MTLKELMVAVETILPGAGFDFDNQGQIVIYTGLCIDAGSAPDTLNLIEHVIEEIA